MRVLSEGEQSVSGWTLLSPEDRSVKLSPKLEEKVLILVCQMCHCGLELTDDIDQTGGICRLVQLFARKSDRVHSDTPQIGRAHV